MTSPHRGVELLVALLVMGVLAGCGAQGQPARTVDPGSGVQGRTTVDAGCPLLKDATPCPDRPLAARITVKATGSDKVVGRTTSDQDGRFRIAVPPGDYVLDAANLSGSPVPAAARQPVTVTAGSFTTVDIPFDSGVR